MSEKKVDLPKKYIQSIRLFLPLNRKAEKMYLKKLKAHVDSFCDDNNSISDEQIFEEFGTPQENAYNYLTTLDSEEIAKAIDTKRLVYRTITFASIISVVTAIVFSLFVYKITLSNARQIELFEAYDYPGVSFEAETK